jgi:hypothetical protein
MQPPPPPYSSFRGIAATATLTHLPAVTPPALAAPIHRPPAAAAAACARGRPSMLADPSSSSSPRPTTTRLAAMHRTMRPRCLDLTTNALAVGPLPPRPCCRTPPSPAPAGRGREPHRLAQPSPPPLSSPDLEDKRGQTERRVGARWGRDRELGG